ncbi:MAG: hypothetical protein A2Z20_05835 [Bdellovibrionales bacterium RBG_16_40_8]|nr:MAG: hypothetical protein A2Z20_05835 [Bdellovibrionales bacterium RBG_16_40_8]
MDQGDEFEMKPLTSGLGFHKRQTSLKDQIAKVGLAQNNMRRSLPTEPPAELLESTRPRTSKEILAELHEALKPIEKKAKPIQITEILPRDISDVKNPAISPEISPIENVAFQLPDKSLSESTGTRRSASDNFTKKLTPVAVSFSAIILDVAIVLAISLIFLVSLITATGVDLVSVMQSSQKEFATQLSLIVMYFAVYEMYVIVSRSFFGCTISEWTFDLQMGDDEQILKARYPAQVLWRSILMLITGLVILPLGSLLFGRDLAAKFSGLQLYRRNI